jgi:hypothetical protein
VSGTPLSTPEDVVAVLRFLRHQPFADDAWARLVLLPALRGEDPHQADGPTAAAPRTGRAAKATARRTTAGSAHQQPLAVCASYLPASAAAVEALVARHGTGLQLLRSLLTPILWRNTLARVRALGQLSIPPVHEFVISVRLTPGEDALLRQLTHTHAPLVGELRSIVEADAAGFSGSGSQQQQRYREETLASARQAVWDLRMACISSAAGDRARRRLGLGALLAGHRNSSLSGES